MHCGGSFHPVSVPLLILLDAKRGHHVVPACGEGLWKSSKEMVLATHPGMG